ncbi:hypothetical protein FQN60_008831, partial [Etheostoma spectabile]
MSQTQTVWLLLVSVSLASSDSMADKTQLPTRDRALKGREEKMVVTADCAREHDLAVPNNLLLKYRTVAQQEDRKGLPEGSPGLYKHAVNGNPTVEPFPEGMETIMFGLGCFWGAERLFWRLPGVFSTQVGYAGGFTPNPTYQEVCSVNYSECTAPDGLHPPPPMTYFNRMVSYGRKMEMETDDRKRECCSKSENGRRSSGHDGAEHCDGMRPRSCQHSQGRTDSWMDRQMDRKKGLMELLHQFENPCRQLVEALGSWQLQIGASV